MLAIGLPQKTIKAMNKICRGFLWCAEAQASGGQCAVAWEQVCTPRWAGGLEIPNLKWLNVATQARWPWLQKTDSTRPWAEFSLKVLEVSRQLCRAAMSTTIGSGTEALFWEDKWIDGASTAE